MNRSHHCNALRKEHAGQRVCLTGWINHPRDHGGILFLDLRDREGVTQIVIDPANPAFATLDKQFKPESVIEVRGKVVLREAATINAKMDTGEVEVVADNIIVHNVSRTPPFPMEDDKADKVNEDLRLRYRYLDLRRPKNFRILKARHQAAQAVRHYLDEQAFLEVETPILFKSTPEGAREFLVPSRLNPGQFYALPQSPQQFKQMLMVSGVERYYQLARCFRDEDLRADRQPEFTQVDIEMSFIGREDIYALIEGLLKRVWKDVQGRDIPTPFPRMSYDDAMNRYGVDKPDTRFAFEIQDFTELFKTSGFKVFAGAANSGGVVKAVNMKGLADLTQGEMKHLEDTAKSLGAKGLAFIKCQGGEWKSPLTKFFSDAEKAELTKRLGIEEGDIVFFAADGWDRACAILGRTRLEGAQLLSKKGRLSIPADQFNFLWVIDFPLMSYDEDLKRYMATHHPFTAAVEEDLPLLDTAPNKVRGQHYDIVLNGNEIGGGSIRIHQPEVQKKVFEDVLKIPADVVEDRFGYMLEAFHYGAPPHGGIALGFDRLVTLLTGATCIRDVVAFPKTQKGQCLMTSSPVEVTPKQLRDVFIERMPLDEKK